MDEFPDPILAWTSSSTPSEKAELLKLTTRWRQALLLTQFRPFSPLLVPFKGKQPVHASVKQVFS